MERVLLGPLPSRPTLHLSLHKLCLDSLYRLCHWAPLPSGHWKVPAEDGREGGTESDLARSLWAVCATAAIRQPSPHTSHSSWPPPFALQATCPPKCHWPWGTTPSLEFFPVSCLHLCKQSLYKISSNYPTTAMLLPVGTLTNTGQR